MKTLKDVLPFEFRNYQETRAYRFRDVCVVREVDGTVHRWPGKEKNVYAWYVLENGYAVGWNENVSRGWSFPVKKI